jgi:hypothetical protein
MCRTVHTIFCSGLRVSKGIRSTLPCKSDIPKETIEQFSIKAELDTFTAQLGLPKRSFDGLADKIEQYVIEHSDKRSYSLFMV